MKVIGITGGIGSGKSLVADILRKKYKARVLNTDLIAKEQMEVGGESYQRVVGYFGAEILNEDRSINRNKLGSIVFQNKEKLAILNELTHPPVIQTVKRDIRASKEAGTVPYLVIETALMIEAGLDHICDEVWYIYSSEEDRRSRLKSTRNYTDEKIDAIFESQSKEEEFKKRYPKVIINNGDFLQIEEQVKALLIQ